MAKKEVPEPRKTAQWFYGPGGAADIFQPEDEVPEGWQDHPSKVVEEKPGEPMDL